MQTLNYLHVTHTAPVRYLRVMMMVMCPIEFHIYTILMQYYNILSEIKNSCHQFILRISLLRFPRNEARVRWIFKE